ncbi:FUSC family protein [Bdellovibrio bacteriovorus]|uniref:FUSC family protein n=1 Tax=Bdellovibrio TaxID=958 RepID=UPI0035A97421
MSLRDHLQEVLKINPVPSPWPRMFVCAFATAFPLVIGVWTHQLPISIFGALVGFLLVLNDHLGTLGHRLWVITLTFLFLLGGLVIGVMTASHKPLLIPILLALTYWMGLMGGKGAELERAILFGTFQVLAGAYSLAIEKYLKEALAYAFLGYICVVVFLSVLVFLRRHKPNPFTRLRATLKDSLTTERNRHLYAFSYSLSVFIALIIVDYFKVDHGYWAVGTVLIIMRPDAKQSIYRSVQRFFGTLIGVLVAEALILTIHSPWLAILALTLISFWGPWALSRSYWLGSAVVVVMLLLILDMPSIEHGDMRTPLLRLQATGLGCLLSLLGVIIANPQFLWKDSPPKE